MNFEQLREATKSADKKPEKYVAPDGKTKVRMVPVDKEVVKEEDLDEISLSNLTKTIAKSTGTKNINKAMGKDNIKKDLEAMKARMATEEKDCECDMEDGEHDDDCPMMQEKKLTSAEKKKREEIAKAMERENPGMDMSKKMAIATAAAKRVAEKKDYAPGHIGAIQKMIDKEREAKKAKDAMKKEESELDEAQGTAAKYAGKSGMFGGKYTSKDRMMDMPLDKLNKIRKKRQDQKHDAHMKQDPKMAKMGYAKHMLDTDKADAKAKKRGIDPTGKYDKYKKANNIKDSVQEVLDTPKAMQSYKDKANYSRERAAKSAVATDLRSKDEPFRAHPAKDLKTMAKRTAGLRMADKAATRKTFKALRAKK